MNPDTPKILILSNHIYTEIADNIISQLQKEGIETIYFSTSNGSPHKNCHFVKLNNSEKILSFVEQERIDLTFVTSKYWLQKDIVTDFHCKNTLIIGSTKSATELENNIYFFKNLLHDISSINQPRFCCNVSFEYADLIKDTYGLPLVIKMVDSIGIKDVYVCQTEEQWKDIFYTICVKKDFGKDAPKYINIEEYIEGDFISVTAVCDRDTHLIIGSSLANLHHNELIKTIDKTIISAILGRMKYEDKIFTGFLTVNIIIKDDTLYVVDLKINYITKDILAQISSSFFEMIYKASLNDLNNYELTFNTQSDPESALLLIK
jgi:phosphoribosylamine-glycine ligase